MAAGCHLDGSSTPSRRLFTYIFAPDLKMLEHRRFSPETHPSAAATKNPNSGDRSSCSGTLPALGIALGAIFIAVVAYHDAPAEGGIDESVLLPQLRQQALLIP